MTASLPRLTPAHWTAMAGVTAVLLAAAGITFDATDREARRQAQTDDETQTARVYDPLQAVSLDKVRATGIVPPVFTARILTDLDALDLDAKKQTFLKIILPLVARENARIRDERRHAAGPAKDVPEYIWEKYKVKPGDVTTLRRRIDVIPASMVLAQAALESGWGTSRFARDANNLFGIRTYNPDTPGLEPEKADGFKVVKYPDLSEGMGHYMLNLNTHPAYLDFRRARKQMRDQGRDPDARHLATRLTQYSEIPKTYSKLLHQIIDAEKLEDFDGVRLVNEG
ncbi:MAG: glucosaminidase domain-containing protein [Rhodospirillales bacterium]